MLELLKMAGVVKKYASVVEKAQKLDANGNGVADSEDHKRNISEIVGLAGTLREKIDAELSLLRKDAEALGLLDLVAEIDAPHDTEVA